MVFQRFTDLISEALAEGKTVELRDFGVFEVKLTKGRVGRNPRNPGHAVPIPPRPTVKFKVGKEMKKEVLKLSPVLMTNGEKPTPASCQCKQIRPY